MKRTRSVRELHAGVELASPRPPCLSQAGLSECFSIPEKTLGLHLAFMSATKSSGIWTCPAQLLQVLWFLHLPARALHAHGSFSPLSQ